MTKRKKIILACLPSLLGPLFMFHPLIITLSTTIIANVFGLQLSEAGPPPNLPVIGDILYSMVVYGWFALITIPLGIIVVPWGIIISIIMIRTILLEERRVTS